MPLFLPRSHKTWRTWLAMYVFIAVAWPATGPLPWLVFESAQHIAADESGHHGERRLDVGYAANGDANDDANDDAYDAPGIPGSPTHPLDHNCAQCEVLKHLARCVLPGASEPGVAPAPGDAVVPCRAQQSRSVSFIATRPPIRGPPTPSV